MAVDHIYLSILKGEIKLVLTMKLSSYWLAFKLQEGTTYIMRQGFSVDLPSSETWEQWWLTWQGLSTAQKSGNSGMNAMGAIDDFLIGFKGYPTEVRTQICYQ